MKNNFFILLDFYGSQFIFFLKLLFIFSIKHFFNDRFKSRKIWLIGENFGECLKDNGYFFFKYCSQLSEEIEVFFIIRKNSKNYDNYLRLNKNVLFYGSLRHVFYLTVANTFIYTHSHRDIAYKKIFLFLKITKKLVFLQHGIIGLKNIGGFYEKNCYDIVDIFIVTSSFEKHIVKRQLGLDNEKIKITGLSRYDYLFNEKDVQPRQIAYIPTWREWINNTNFENSLCKDRFNSLLNSSELIKILSKHNLMLKFYFHKNMKDFSGRFFSCSERIKIIHFGQETVQELIKRSSLLITDYSSVSWDFYYLKKPIIFYQFDLNDYLEKRGSYMDLKIDAFGDTVEIENQLIDLIEYYANKEFTERENYAKLRGKYFQYSDRKNCERIYKEIINL